MQEGLLTNDGAWICTARSYAQSISWGWPKKSCGKRRLLFIHNVIDCFAYSRQWIEYQQIECSRHTSNPFACSSQCAYIPSEDVLQHFWKYANWAPWQFGKIVFSSLADQSFSQYFFLPVLLWGFYKWQQKMMRQQEHSCCKRSLLMHWMARASKTQITPANLAQRELPPGNWSNFTFCIQAWRLSTSSRCASRAAFYACSKEWRKALRFRPHSKHSVCHLCDTLKSRMKHASNFMAHAKATDNLLEHLSNMWRCRQAYWLAREKSRAKQDLLTIIYDGFDKAKPAIPRWSRGQAPKQAAGGANSENPFGGVCHPCPRVWLRHLHGWRRRLYGWWLFLELHSEDDRSLRSSSSALRPTAGKDSLDSEWQHSERIEKFFVGVDVDWPSVGGLLWWNRPPPFARGPHPRGHRRRVWIVV